jgi:hypothetical protein
MPCATGQYAGLKPCLKPFRFELLALGFIFKGVPFSDKKQSS